MSALLHPWVKASFSGDAAWEQGWKNLLRSHRYPELVNHSIEEWAELGNLEISITG